MKNRQYYPQSSESNCTWGREWRVDGVSGGRIIKLRIESDVTRQCVFHIICPKREEKRDKERERERERERKRERERERKNREREIKREYNITNKTFVSTAIKNMK